MGNCQNLTFSKIEELKLIENYDLDIYERMAIPDKTLAIQYNFTPLMTQQVQLKLQNSHDIFPDEYNDTQYLNLCNNYYLLTDGSIYQGFWQFQKPSGWGKLHGNDFSFYEGNFTNGIFNGRGRYINCIGDCYYGFFYNGYFHGNGNLNMINGYQYKGEFKNNMIDGFGTEIKPNKNMNYTGHFIKNKKNGKGKQSWGSKSNHYEEFYDGDFLDDFQHGQGFYQWNDGRSYKGSWSKGKMHGLGEFTWKNQIKYKGEYKFDYKHGYGEMFWPNNSIFKGMWYKGERHGHGIFQNSRNEKINGIWQHGQLIKIIETPPIFQISNQNGQETKIIQSDEYQQENKIKQNYNQENLIMQNISQDHQSNQIDEENQIMQNNSQNPFVQQDNIQITLLRQDDLCYDQNGLLNLDQQVLKYLQFDTKFFKEQLQLQQNNKNDHNENFLSQFESNQYKNGLLNVDLQVLRALQFDTNYIENKSFQFNYVIEQSEINSNQIYSKKSMNNIIENQEIQFQNVTIIMKQNKDMQQNKQISELRSFQTNDNNYKQVLNKSIEKSKAQQKFDNQLLLSKIYQSQEIIQQQIKDKESKDFVKRNRKQEILDQIQQINQIEEIDEQKFEILLQKLHPLNFEIQQKDDFFKFLSN